jgi:two-component system sensor histidine kinase YesM
LVRKYLSIEKIRYGEQFQFEIEVAEDCLMQPVPAFSIQPLVENAIKYAVDSQLEPVTIKVNIRRDNQTLKIKVIDDGPGLIKGHSTGLGLALQNIANRLENLYGGAAKLTLQNGDNKGVVVVLKIPMSSLKD